MNLSRASGILLHPTSLPGAFGIGELGNEAYRFVDWLTRARQSLWQVLPLGPTGYGDSPYASFSAFAGNPLLISLERLCQEGLLREAEWADLPSFPDESVDYGTVIPFKMALLRRSFERWQNVAGEAERTALDQFRAEQATWLEEFALFMAIKEAHGGVAWSEWRPEIASRQPDALHEWRESLSASIEFHIYLQSQFFRQWFALKQYANERGVRIIGDLPIFVAYDSADVWASPHLFYLDESGNPTVIAGVPPDTFSETGQRWGNPLYRWDVMAQEGYRWWIERFRQTLQLVDVVRIDHFRGFAAYWEVPAEELTAIKGCWVPGPGLELFQTVERELGPLPVIAEDLGLITPDVVELREACGFPGMKVLQFAFEGDASNPYLPHNYTPDTVVYTGTHDNDTSEGWFENAPEEERAAFLRYVGCQCQPASQAMIRLAMSSVAKWAILPLQDVMGLGSEARMNLPGQESGWWRWRYRSKMLTDEPADWLGELTITYGR